MVDPGQEQQWQMSLGALSGQDSNSAEHKHKSVDTCEDVKAELQGTMLTASAAV